MNILDEKCHPKKRASFGQELNINDYSEQDTLSNQNCEESEELPLEEIEQILCEEGNVLSHKETILINKINHLQNKCNRLTITNYQLARQVEDLEEDNLGLSQAEISESTANQFLQIMQKEINDYKNHFQQYRNHQVSILKAKDEEVQKLKGVIQDLKLEKDCLQQSRDNAFDENEEISKLNQELVIQIERLEEEFMQINSQKSSRFTAYPPDKSTFFEGEVQVQLESLIQKLMRQLKAERLHKKRMNEQIKIMQQQILDLQRQLSVKNQQIIALEMSYLKSNRSGQLNNKNNDDKPLRRTPTLTRTNSKAQDTVQNGCLKQTQNLAVLKPFSLAQWLQNDLQINSRERLIIAGKIIDFYLKKIANKDFDSFELQNILVCNFSHRNPRLCLIRKDQANIQHEDEGSQQLLIQNLILILNALFNDGRSANESKLKCQTELINIISRMIKEKDYSPLDVNEIKQIIVDSSKGRV